MPEFFDHLTDVVVVGSGAAGAVTALAAKEAGLEPLILESTDMFGGSSALSGGAIWIPGNHLMERAGVQDSLEEAREYLDFILEHTEHPGGAAPASSPARRAAYLERGPEMARWLEGLGFQWRYAKGYPDHYPHCPGGSRQGRAIEARKYDLKRLGRWAEKLRSSLRGIALSTTDAAALSTSRRSPRALLAAAKAVGIDSLAPRAMGRNMVGLGNALMGRLLELLLDRTIPIWLESEVTELIVQEGRVTGVVITRHGETLNIGAARGVMIASGGFEKNGSMRTRHHTPPSDPQWSSGAPGNTGAPIEAAARAGVELATMDSAWWAPTALLPSTSQQPNTAPGTTPTFLSHELSLPHGIVVASDGRRFMNESECYVDAGHHLYAKDREEGVTAIPAWHIIDSRHRTWYPYGAALPGIGTKKMVESGFMIQADTLDELARRTGIDPEGLRTTIERFNEFARTGVDEDFSRGSNAHDTFHSDPRVKPNPTLGAISKPPFYAIEVYPGDLGTNGGVLTDEFARALLPDGSVLPGLYAAGNASASVMGYTYPGPGATIGAAMVFGFIAGRHMSGSA
ncbi:MAG: FAD-dependent oxidoreductase [bacterium]|nr:FAD-dependent oxidoreductase [bacterium]